MKKFFLFAVVAAAVMMCMSACEDNLKPEVIDSEVVGSGADANVIVKTTTDDNGVNTQSLSYKSWIRVKGQTKANFDDTVTVELTGELPDVAQEFNREFRVDALTMNMAQTEIGYRLGDIREEGFVTISDSVLVYTLRHGNFTFSYELVYEVPVYDDGVTREVMPYYRYENIVDKGYTLEPQDSKVKDGIAYGCALYRHELEVTFNGKVYTLHANVTLLKELGPASQPYIVRSEVMNSSYTSFTDHIMSYFTIKRTWSTGNVETTDYSVNLLGQIQEVIGDIPRVEGYTGSITYESSRVIEDETYYNGSENNIYVFRHKKRYEFKWNHFSFYLDVFGDVAYYDDDVTFFELLGNDIIDVSYDTSTLNIVNSGTSEGHDFVYYRMTWSVNGRFSHSGYNRELVDDILCFYN